MFDQKLYCTMALQIKNKELHFLSEPITAQKKIRSRAKSLLTTNTSV